jgi:hypothetical protein
MEVSYRQAKRVLKRYRALQDKGLIHGNRGRQPGNAYAVDFKESILRLYQTKYLEFGPTFAAEKLLDDDGKKVHPETLRLWLKAEGLWTKKRKHKLHREHRERRPRFGELLQIDGSIHQWFDGIPEKSCLLNMVDDATGLTLAFFDKGETTYILLKTFKKWIELYGIPKAVYVDLKSVYVGAKRLKSKYDDDFGLTEGMSVFEEVCKKLSIQIIRAYSPQAKGRVERKHRVFQDRLVKDLKLYKIRSLEKANAYLEQKFLPNINQKFAKTPKNPHNAHRKAKSYGDLDQIICWNYKRQLKNNWTVQFKRSHYQINKESAIHVKPEDFILIKQHLDQRLRFWYKKHELNYTLLSQKPLPFSKTKKYYLNKGIDHLNRSQLSTKNKHKSPWSRYNPSWLQT